VPVNNVVPVSEMLTPDSEESEDMMKANPFEEDSVQPVNSVVLPTRK